MGMAGQQCFQSGPVMALALILAAALAAAPHRVQAAESRKLEEVFPFRSNGYTLGSPLERNNATGAKSGISDPDSPDAQLRKGFYTIGCTPLASDVVVFTEWDEGPRGRDNWFVGPGYSLSVIAFIENDHHQYIYGMIANGRALTNGTPVLVPSKEWHCRVMKG